MDHIYTHPFWRQRIPLDENGDTYTLGSFTGTVNQYSLKANI